MPPFIRKLGLVLVLVIAALGAMCFLFPHKLTQLALGMERHRAGLHRSEIDIPGFHIVYLEGGQGEPLILLHGIGADKDNFTRTSRWLTAHYHVIAPDLPGFGESSKSETATYTVDDQVRNVAAFANALHLTRFSIGGNSMGGWIAGAYVAEHPDQIITAWLQDPGGVAGAKKSEMMDIIDKGGQVPIFARTPAEMHALMSFVFVHPPYLPGVIIDEVAREQSSNYQLNLKIFGELTADWQAHAIDKLLAGSKTPTLITWGDHDRVLDVSGAEALHKVMPNSTVAIMPDIGHVPAVEAPEASADDYLKFRAGAVAQAPAATAGT
jgi:triacylglycerol lipase